MSKGSIFVQCASYRDPELRNTVRTALENASDPGRVNFGICWQGKMAELREQLHFRSSRRCRTILIDSDESRGIGYARQKAQMMYEGEEFTLQIDSHMKFLPGWDRDCRRMLNDCPSDRPLLTAYLSDHDAGEEPFVYRLGVTRFTRAGNVIITGVSQINKARHPQPGVVCSAHFVFARSEFFDEVPVDPDMQFLYEETLIAPRAYTSGWDIYYPNQAVLQHKWNRDYRRTNWEDHDVTPLEKKCRGLYRQIVSIAPGYQGRYGLGIVRSLEEYEAYSGIDFRNRVLSPGARKGRPSSR